MNSTIDQKPKRTITANGQTFESFEQLVDSYRSGNPNDVIEEKNAYTDPVSGKAEFYTLRIRKGSGKTFRQASKIDGTWQWKGCQGKAPLFNRVRLKDCSMALIVEGEKCVREFTKLGMSDIAGTTSPGGAVNATKADWTPLAGKDCYVWRDFDEPGLRYEADVIAELRKIDCRVFRIRVEELELDPKGDLADYLDLSPGTNQDKIAAMKLILHDAEPMHATSALAERFDQIAAGGFRSIDFTQKPILSKMSKAIMPGTVTTICGDPGAGKSFFVLEDAWRWTLAGERVKLLMLEDDDAFHQGRALAQMSGYADLTDADFVLRNPGIARGQLANFRHDLEAFSRNLETVRSEQRTLDQISDWVQMHAQNGVRIIIVDPITAAKVSDKPWTDDQRFLFRVKNILEKTGASLILTTHPRIGLAGKPSLSGMAGGASYPRFSQCVLWLRNHDAEKESQIAFGPLVKHRQTIEIRKARNGRGQGSNIAINLNFQNLCFDELGTISNEQ